MKLNFSPYVRPFPPVCTPAHPAVLQKAYSDNLVNTTRRVASQSSFSQRREPWYQFTDPPTVTVSQIARARADIPRARYPQLSTVRGLLDTTTPRFGGVTEHARNLAPAYFCRSASATLPASRVQHPLTPQEGVQTRSAALVRSTSLRPNNIGSVHSNIMWKQIPA